MAAKKKDFVRPVFPKGNNYWQFRNKHGRDHKYTPDGLWDEAMAYFTWVEEHPLWEQKGFAFQGVVTKENFAKMRAMTITAFCLFADICSATWKHYKENSDFVKVVTRIEKVIYSQKFEGASADLLNANIIARDLGLKERSDITTDDEKINESPLTDKERALLADLLENEDSQ